MKRSSSAAEVSELRTPSPPRPPPARPAASQEKMLARVVERERRSFWAFPLSQLIRKATKKGKNTATSRNILLPPPSQSRTRQEGLGGAKNGAGDAQGPSSMYEKSSEAIADATALDRSGCAATMRCALARIQGGDASHDAEAFSEMVQATKNLIDVLFEQKVNRVLPGVLMSNFALVDDCLEKWSVLIDPQKNWKLKWKHNPEELRVTIILNLSVHRPNRILAGATQLPDVLKKIADKLHRLGCPALPSAKVASIVSNLSVFEDFRKKILDIGGMEMLWNLLKIEGVAARMEAISAICVLCGNQEGRTHAQSCNVPDLLVECLTITDEALVLLDCLPKDPYMVDQLCDKAVKLVNNIMADQETEPVIPKASYFAISLAHVIVQGDTLKMNKRNYRDKRSHVLEPEEANKDSWGWAIAALRVVWLVVFSVWRALLFWPMECCFGWRRLPEVPQPGYSWLSVMGSPIINTDSSCVISACSMCIVAQHTLAFERLHGKGSFRCKAKVPSELKFVCSTKGVWNSKYGADVTDVLKVIIDMGGLLAARGRKSIRLQIADYVVIRKNMQPESRNRFARTLYAHGPLIGSLWASDLSYHNCLGDMVYRGCPPQQRVPGSGEYHAVVCFEYKFMSDKKELHIRIMDNHDANGPLRWVLFEAFRCFHLPIVEKPVEPHQLLRNKRKSKEHTLSIIVKKVKFWLIRHEAGRYLTRRGNIF